MVRICRGYAATGRGLPEMEHKSGSAGSSGSDSGRVGGAAHDERKDGTEKRFAITV